MIKYISEQNENIVLLEYMYKDKLNLVIKKATNSFYYTGNVIDDCIEKTDICYRINYNKQLSK